MRENFIGGVREQTPAVIRTVLISSSGCRPSQFAFAVVGERDELGRGGFVAFSNGFNSLMPPIPKLHPTPFHEQ
jgi:hypothetical protein